MAKLIISNHLSSLLAKSRISIGKDQYIFCVGKGIELSKKGRMLLNSKYPWLCLNTPKYRVTDALRGNRG